MIALVIAGLSGLLAIGVAVDLAKSWMVHDAQRRYEQTSHAALMRELRRQP